MRIEYVQKNDTIHVKLFDKLTFADHVAFRKLIDETKQSKARALILDVAELSMIDSSGLGMLMIALDEAKKSGFALNLVNATGPVQQLLKISRMDVLFKAA